MNVVSAMPTWQELKESKTDIMDAVVEFRAELAAATADDRITLAEACRLAVAGMGVLEVVVVELSGLATQVGGMTRDERRKWIGDIAWEAYKTDLDFDIPWIVEPMETWVERKVIKELVPQAVLRIEKLFGGGA